MTTEQATRAAILSAVRAFVQRGADYLADNSYLESGERHAAWRHKDATFCTCHEAGWAARQRALEAELAALERQISDEACADRVAEAPSEGDRRSVR